MPIYLMREVGESDYVKVGWSGSPLSRLERLQTGNPRSLYISATIDGTRGDERKFHAAFGHRAVVHSRITEQWTSEWYELGASGVDPLRDWVDRCEEESECSSGPIPREWMKV